MTSQEHAQLLRELAEHAESPTELAPFEISGLADCARQAAEEIEERVYPPLHRWNFEMREDGLYACRHHTGQHCEYERLTEAMVRKGARFGGGEGES